MKLAILYLLWLLYSAFEGVTEGYLWQYKETNYMYQGVITKLHTFFTVKRVIVAILIGLNLEINLCKDILLAVSLIGSFSFLHNGIMYSVRNSIDKNVYKKRFLDYSSTSTSKIELTYDERLWSFVFSILIIIILEYYDKIF